MEDTCLTLRSANIKSNGTKINVQIIFSVTLQWDMLNMVLPSVCVGGLCVGGVCGGGTWGGSSGSYKVSQS